MRAACPVPRASEKAGDDSGAYCLLIRLRAESEAQIGRLGRFRFPQGYYVYCGSAMRGLAARIARHRRRAKNLHWHIDYLLALPSARLLGAAAYPSPRRRECALNRAVQRLPGATTPVPGFGASDCPSRCPAHLTHFARQPFRLPSPLHFPQCRGKRESRSLGEGEGGREPLLRGPCPEWREDKALPPEGRTTCQAVTCS